MQENVLCYNFWTRYMQTFTFGIYMKFALKWDPTTLRLDNFHFFDDATDAACFLFSSADVINTNLVVNCAERQLYLNDFLFLSNFLKLEQFFRAKITGETSELI